MSFPDLNQSLGLLGTPFEIGVCLLALVRGLWRRLPWFTAYILLVNVVDDARWAVLFLKGVGSPAYARTYWLTQMLLIVARGAALADVCRAALSGYTGVWQLARYLLAGTAAALLLVAAVHTSGTQGITSSAIFVERELEFAVVITLLLLLVLSRYYGVGLDPPLGGLALGLAFYSSIVIVTSSILIGRLALPWALFSRMRTVGWNVTLGCWLYALRAPLTAPSRPELSTVESYEENTRLVSGRMRELNARLLALTRR
jgi:hypothetical protein